jgi:hypothetical protein
MQRSASSAVFDAQLHADCDSFVDYRGNEGYCCEKPCEQRWSAMKRPLQAGHVVGQKESVQLDSQASWRRRP